MAGLQSSGQIVITSSTVLSAVQAGGNILTIGSGITLTFPSGVFTYAISNISASPVGLVYPLGSDFGPTLPPGQKVILACDGGGFWRVVVESTPMGSGVYSVLAYGALGNGSNDDTGAINAAIAACAGGVVYFPAGTYRITSPLNVSSKSGCILRGDGSGATYIKNSNRTANAVTFSSCQYCGIEEMSIYSDRSSGNPTAGFAIEFNGNSYDSHITKANIGYCYNGIKIYSSTETLIEQVLIRGPFGAYGILYTGTAGTPCYGMTISDLVVDTIDTGNVSATLLQMDSYANSLTVKRAALLQGGIGLLMADSAGLGASSRPNFAYIFDLECDHNYTCGVLLNGGNAFYLTGAFIGSCLAGNGMLVNSSYGGDASVTAARVLGNAQYGILINNGPQDITIGNCIIALNGQQSANTYHGIFFNNVHTIVTGCRVGGAAGVTGQQRYGIFAQSSASYYVVVGNDTSGNLTGGINNAGSAPNSVTSNI